MKILKNPYRGRGLDHPDLNNVPYPVNDAAPAIARVATWTGYDVSPMARAPSVARASKVGEVWVKDERERLRMGSFKALGAAYVIARDADLGQAAGRTYVAASAGNHGLSVAFGAARFGAKARIYLSDQVPEVFAERLRDHGAEVVRAGASYEESMAAAEAAARDEGHTLLSDSSWPGYTEIPHILMEGYLVIFSEAVAQSEDAPEYIFLQAGVGGLAGAAAAKIRKHWGDGPIIVVVEPDAAPALMGSIEAGAPVTASGPVSAMGRLDCKAPSLIALKGLAHDADYFMTISEAEGQAGAQAAKVAGLPSTPSGAAGIAGLLAGASELGIGEEDRVLTILTEIAE